MMEFVGPFHVKRYVGLGGEVAAAARIVEQNALMTL